MWPFGRCETCAAISQENLTLRSTLQDMADSRIREQEAFAKERASLVEKIMALTNPAALRELRRPPDQARVVPITTSPRRPFVFPGIERDTRPPDPPDPKKDN